MRRLLIVLALTVVAPSAKAADIYFSQSGGGSGASCASPRALSSHVIGDDVAGNILHLCGTITVAANTNAFTALAAGASGNPITLKWESGAILQAPYWPGNNLVNSGLAAVIISKSNWTIDGGTNGILQATENGSVLANQKASNGIFSSGASNLIVKNLTIQNLYVHSLISDEVVSELGQLALGVNLVNCTNCRVTANTIHDVLDGVYIVSTSPSGLTNLEIDHNTIYNINIGLDGGVANPNSMSNLYAHDNSIGSMVNWDDTNDNSHHNHIHWFSSGTGASISGIYVYNNQFIGDPGIHMTATLNLEPTGGGTLSNVNVFNNVRRNDSPTCSHTDTAYSDMSTVTAGHLVVNNTLIGPGTCQNPINGGLGSEANGGIERNNIVDNYGYAHTVSSSVTSWTVSNNIYGRSGTFAVQHNGSFTSYNFGQWQTLTGGDASPPSVNTGAAIAVQTTSPFKPLTSTSPPVNAGFNLFSTCNGQPVPGLGALCFDINGVARPSSGNWDAGAAQFVGVVPPNAPSGLTASVAGSTVTLNWTASAGTPIPTGYSLYRGTVHGGPYTLIKTALTSTSTTDTPANGTYFYTVTAFVGGLVSTISGNGSTATVTCMTACPSFPTSTAFTIFGNSVAGFNGTFTSTGQPTNSTFTFNSSTNSVGSGGAAWPTAQESVKSNEVSATVPAALTASLSPASRTFASQTVGTTSPSQSFTFTNTSGPGGNVIISGFAFTSGNTGDFGVSTPCGTAPITVSSGASCIFNVTFTPTAAGSRSATLTVTDNTTSSPHSSTVTGTGVALTPGVNLNPTSLSFGEQTLSTTSSVRSIILTNTGTGTLTISSVVASGDFAVVTVPATNCGGTLASLATCSLNVNFTPTATGGRTGAVTVTDNASGSPHVATLSGTGITTKCAITGNVTLSGAGSVCQ